MDWWQWLVLGMGLLVFLGAMFYGVQTRRRKGGVIATRGVRPRGRTP